MKNIFFTLLLIPFLNYAQTKDRLTIYSGDRNIELVDGFIFKLIIENKEKNINETGYFVLVQDKNSNPNEYFGVIMEWSNKLKSYKGNIQKKIHPYKVETNLLSPNEFKYKSYDVEYTMYFSNNKVRTVDEFGKNRGIMEGQLKSIDDIEFKISDYALHMGSEAFDLGPIIVDNISDKSSSPNVLKKNHKEPIFKISGDHLSDYKGWYTLKDLDVYFDKNFDKKIGAIKNGDKFDLLKADYLFYDLMKVRITKLLGHCCLDCSDNGFKIGDEINPVIDYSEAWGVLHNGILTNTSFYFNFEEGKIEASPYESCNVWEGIIIKNTEDKDLIVKIKTKTGLLGWIKIELRGTHKLDWESIRAW